ncbi:hypothetical protein Tco_1519528, partial [Tanacetum coccineum]
GMFKRENVDYLVLIWEDIAYQIDHRKEKRSRRENMLKFVRIGEYYQEYGLPISDVMLTDAIKRSNHIRCSLNISLIKFHPRRAEKKTASRRVVKKKVTLSIDDNIISDEPDIALELDIMQALKESKKSDKRQLGTRGLHKGTSTIPWVPDESTIVSTTSSKGTGAKPEVPDEEKDITKEKVILEWGDEQESEYFEDDDDDDDDNVEKDDKDDDADDKGDDHISDTQYADEEDVETESDEDDIYKYKIRVRKDEDEEMINAEVDDSDKGDEKITDAAKEDVEKTSEEKDDAKKIELPPSSLSLFVSLGFSDQFLKLSFDSSLVSTVKDTTNIKINSLLEVKIQSEVPHTQSPSMLSVPVYVIFEPTIPTPV